MMNGGDAAEQVVKISLEGLEVAARISGSGAKNIAILLAAVMREEHKTAGKARLTSMIKSGKELKVFSVQEKDLQKFSQQAKRYGVLYCALRDKNAKHPTATVDIIARADDASKIQRIMERFELAKTDVASVVGSVEKSRQANQSEQSNPLSAKTEKDPLSEPKSKKSQKGLTEESKPSVREKLKNYKAEIDKQKAFDLGEKVASKSDKEKVM